jgi:hypothetical protein
MDDLEAAMSTDAPPEIPIEGPADREAEMARRGDPRPTSRGSEWHPELAERLYELLHTSEMWSPELDMALQELESTYHNAVYAEMIHLLSLLRFEPKEARQHWRNIVEHRDSVQNRLGSPVDLRVALVSYFMQVNRKLRNPNR